MLYCRSTTDEEVKELMIEISSLEEQVAALRAQGDAANGRIKELQDALTQAEQDRQVALHM